MWTNQTREAVYVISQAASQTNEALSEANIVASKVNRTATEAATNINEVPKKELRLPP